MEVLLRKLQSEDATALTALLNNKNIWDNLRNTMPHPYFYKHAVEFINRVQTIEDKDISAICADGQLVGCIGLHGQSDVYERNLELGYWIGEPFWGRALLLRR